MKLLKYQREAYKEFEKTGYVCIDSCRRSGKTELLKYIISNNNIRDIGIFTLSYAMFKHSYGSLFSPISKVYMNFDKSILLCDEFIMSPIEGKKIACVMTGLPKITRWPLSSVLTFDKKQLKTIKKAMTKEAYMSEFGNYK